MSENIILLIIGLVFCVLVPELTIMFSNELEFKEDLDKDTIIIDLSLSALLFWIPFNVSVLLNF